MNDKRCLLLAVALALGLAGAAAALEVPLTYVPFGDQNTPIVLPYGATGVQLTDKAPSDCKLPAFNMKKPAYGRIKLAGREIPIALDAENASDKFYNRLYIDANGNRDLSDEAPIGSLHASDNLVMFKPADLELKSGDVPFPFRFSSQVYSFGEGAQANMMIITGCAWTGRIESGGKTWRVALGDGNCNGGFDEQAIVPKGIITGREPQRIYPGGDRIAMTTNEQFDSADQMVLGTHLALDGKLFSVKVDIAQKKMILTPVEGGMAMLKAPVKATKLQLLSDDAKTCVMAWGPGESVTVPAGSYQVLSYTIEKTGAEGDVWRATGNAFEDSPWIMAAPDGPGKLKMGPPFSIKAKVADMQSRLIMPNQAQLSFEARDAAGMDVGAIMQVKLDRNSLLPGPPMQAPAPKFEIRTADGKTVVQGQFEYG